MAFELNGKILPLDTPFSSNGISYPANYLRICTPQERLDAGITEVPDPPVYNQTFYNSPGQYKKPEEVKQNLINREKMEVKRRLDPSDWYVVRNIETSKEIPTDIKNYREKVRLAYQMRKNSINECKTTKQIENLTLTNYPE